MIVLINSANQLKSNL